MASVQPGVYAIVDLDACRACRREPLAVARAFCTVPLVGLQLRAKHATDRERLALARAVGAEARAARIPFIVNDRADLARLAGADGVHLGQEDLPARLARRWLGPDRWIGLSTHDVAQVAASATEPVDYLGFGPVFATATKTGASAVVGLDGLRRAVGRATRPIVAIGGIRLEDLPAIRAAGARAAALVSALLQGDPAEQAARAVRLFGG